MTNYDSMTASELLQSVGDSGSAWAEAFCHLVVDHRLKIDKDLMTVWFANAIEHSCDVRRWREEDRQTKAQLAALGVGTAT